MDWIRNSFQMCCGCIVLIALGFALLVGILTSL